MLEDGRTGKVFSVRLSQVERETIAKALRIEQEEKRKQPGGWSWWRPRPVGEFIRQATMAAAEAIVDGERKRTQDLTGNTGFAGKPGTTNQVATSRTVVPRAPEGGSTTSSSRRRK